jgi:hypothetical protein
MPNAFQASAGCQNVYMELGPTVTTSSVLGG